MTRRFAVSALAALANRAEGLTSTPSTDSSTVLDKDGTAHIVRSVPVPKTISPEAQRLLGSGVQFAPDGWTKESAELVRRARIKYPVTVKETTLANVKVKIITPEPANQSKAHRVLINLHGGGFTSDSGSMLETIPIASLTGTTVIAVEYRLAPAYPFPAAVDDSAAVYKAVLGSHGPRDVAIYGTSAGAILAAQTCVYLSQSKLPMPAALGFFSGYADFGRWGDSRSFFSVQGLGNFKPASTNPPNPYVGRHDVTDPVLSPMYANLKGFPPTLCMTGTRDLLMSGTADFHRALLRAEVDARLIVFDAMPHAHWYAFELPESKEALEAQARFLDQHLGRNAD